jgi:hypothetical protein
VHLGSALLAWVPAVVAYAVSQAERASSRTRRLQHQGLTERCGLRYQRRRVFQRGGCLALHGPGEWDPSNVGLAACLTRRSPACGAVRRPRFAVRDLPTIGEGRVSRSTFRDLGRGDALEASCASPGRVFLVLMEKPGRESPHSRRAVPRQLFCQLPTETCRVLPSREPDHERRRDEPSPVLR